MTHRLIMPALITVCSHPIPAIRSGWSLSLRHAGQEQARQRRLQALADGLPLPQPSENLIHRTLPFALDLR